MNIKEHPDFKVTKVKAYCPECEHETEFCSGLNHNAFEDKSPTYNVCQVCGFDYDD